MKEEPLRDPVLAAALRRLEEEELLQDDDWERMRLGIAERCAARLARLRPSDGWWEYTAAWLQVAAPLAIAAGLAFLFLFPADFASESHRARSTAGGSRGARSEVAMVVAGEVPEQEAVDVIVGSSDLAGSSDRDRLLEAVLGSAGQ